jgi:hypothetical protein
MSNTSVEQLQGQPQHDAQPAISPPAPEAGELCDAQLETIAGGRAGELHDDELVSLADWRVQSILVRGIGGFNG